MDRPTKIWVSSKLVFMPPYPSLSLLLGSLTEEPKSKKKKKKENIVKLDLP